MIQAVEWRYRADEEFIGAQDVLKHFAPYADWLAPEPNEVGLLVSAAKQRGVVDVRTQDTVEATHCKASAALACLADDIIADLESRGLGWDICHAPYHFVEVRIWQWPVVICRYRPPEVQPLAAMLAGAVKGIHLGEYPIQVQEKST